MRNTIFLTIVLFISCASYDRTPAQIVQSARYDTTKLNFTCQKDGKGRAECLAVNYGSLVPKWSAFTEGEPTQMGEGAKFVFKVFNHWTLVEMQLEDEGQTHYLRCYAILWTNGSVQFKKWGE